MIRSIEWYNKPIPGALLNPDYTISRFGYPQLEAHEKGFQFPHRFIAIDGYPLDTGHEPIQARGAHLLQQVRSEGRKAVSVTIQTEESQKDCVLAMRPMPSTLWWNLGPSFFLCGLLCIIAALMAISVDNPTNLSRTFAKVLLSSGLFLTRTSRPRSLSQFLFGSGLSGLGG
jgi:hypothetical protein